MDTTIGTELTIRAKDLKVGDTLIATNATVTVAPVLANPAGARNTMYRENDIILTVRYSTGKESTRVWNKNTTVKITRF